MNWTPALTELQGLLIALYPNRELCQRPLDQAQVPTSMIEFKDRAIDNWHNILTEVVKLKKLETLIQFVSEEYQGQSGQLNSAYQRYLEEAAKIDSSLVDDVAVGFAALVRFMKLPEVRDTLLVYSASLRSASKQIDDMGNYKELHDLLHDLQIHCYDPVIQASKRLPADRTVWDDLLTHQLTLQGILDAINDLTGRKTFDPGSMSFILDYLIQAQGRMDEAIVATDLEKLRKATYLLDRVLDVQPPLINIRLNSAARDLRLSDLVMALSSVRDKVVTLELDLDEVKQFITAVETLKTLSTSLSALINEHDKWQSIDQDLRQVEPNLAQGFEELEWSWSRLKQESVPLYADGGETWAKNFRTYTEKLDSAISSKNLTTITESFRLYRRQASDRFYRVDKNLKVLCGELREIGSAPLDAVTNALGRT
jgi:hypothetical protein